MSGPRALALNSLFRTHLHRTPCWCMFLLPSSCLTCTLLLGAVLSLYSPPSRYVDIAHVLPFPFPLCLHWTHPFCENSVSTSVPGRVLESGGEELARLELSTWALSIHLSRGPGRCASVKCWVMSTMDEAPPRCILVLTSWAVPFQVSVLGSVHAVCSAPLRCASVLGGAAASYPQQHHTVVLCSPLLLRGCQEA